MTEAKKRALTGIRTTGGIHIGNYLGAIRPALALQNNYQCLFFLANQHALTTIKDASLLKEFSYQQTALWLSLGLDVEKHILYRQSDLQSMQLAWILASSTGVGFIEKAHSYKDAQANNWDINVGVFFYPILMAADILLFAPDVVPVGKDQKQHVEMARDMAGSFNAKYGGGEAILNLPSPLINEDVALIPGLDGRKMSKSYNNTIELMLPEKKLRKKIMGLETDSSSLEEPKKLEGSNLGNLFKLFASKNDYLDLETRLAKGNMGWGNAKQELFEVVNDSIKEARERYFEIEKDYSYLDSILASGKEKAEEIAEPIINKISEAVGYKF